MLMVSYSRYFHNICRRATFHFDLTYLSSFKFACLRYCSKTDNLNSIGMSILNVAEKNDAAKHLAGFLSRGNLQRREGYSKYNKIYEFECQVQGRQRKMIMTSVSGHLLNLEFVGDYRNWKKCNPADLFDAPVRKFCPPDYEPIKKTLEREVQKCNTLIIWTDCDREGENIGYEIVSVCTAVKPNLQVYRAQFSEITAQSTWRALNSLGRPNERVNQAVDVRTELDLRIGAAFTRFQTLRLQRVFPDTLANNIISYGSCQFPTLGFVVERYKAIERFIPEQFWRIKVTHDVDEVKVDFVWGRVRLFDEDVCRALYERCLENPDARVESVISKPKSKYRPLPLDTVELEKIASRKLRMNAKEAMAAAEKLYTKGLISYPRTETNIFPPDLNLVNLVGLQTDHRSWGDFATRVLQDGPNPRQGKKSDKAHPPIHPTKAAFELNGNEAKVYEFVVRHFLACVSKDAQGHETIVHIDINGEKFVGSGLMVLARNYLDVYPYDNWSDKQMHVYREGQVFRPTTLDMVDGETSAPKLLTEADLIALMEKHGIGTDATHAEHIDKIKTRAYVGLENNVYFVPGHLGIGLVDGYDDMGFSMSKPHLRAELEADLVRICNGEKDAAVVLAEQVAKYREVFRLATEQADKIDAALAMYFNTRPVAVGADQAAMDVLPTVTRCQRCRCSVVIKQRPNNAGWYLGCLGFPDCRTSLWFPSDVTEVTLHDSTCPNCGPHMKQLKLVFQPGSVPPYINNPYIGCVNCDRSLLDVLNLQPLFSTGTQDRPAVVQDNSRASSGYSSMGTSNSQRPATNTRTHFQNSFIEDGSDDESQRRPGWTMNISNNNRGGNNQPSWASNNSRGGNNQQSWASNINSRGGNNQQSWTSNNNSFNDPDDVCCTCGLKARKLEVKKESVNKGRWFFVCSKQREDSSRCDFFQWADDDGPRGGGGDGWGGGGGGGGGPSWAEGSRGQGRGGKKPTPSLYRARPYDSDIQPKQGKKRAAPSTGKGRLCSVCRQPGHTKLNCPFNK